MGGEIAHAAKILSAWRKTVLKPQERAGLFEVGPGHEMQIDFGFEDIEIKDRKLASAFLWRS